MNSITSCNNIGTSTWLQEELYEGDLVIDGYDSMLDLGQWPSNLLKSFSVNAGEDIRLSAGGMAYIDAQRLVLRGTDQSSVILRFPDHGTGPGMYMRTAVDTLTNDIVLEWAQATNMTNTWLDDELDAADVHLDGRNRSLSFGHHLDSLSYFGVSAMDIELHGDSIGVYPLGGGQSLYQFPANAPNDGEVMIADANGNLIWGETLWLDGRLASLPINSRLTLSHSRKKLTLDLQELNLFGRDKIVLTTTELAIRDGSGANIYTLPDTAPPASKQIGLSVIGNKLSWVDLSVGISSDWLQDKVFHVPPMPGLIIEGYEKNITWGTSSSKFKNFSIGATQRINFSAPLGVGINDGNLNTYYILPSSRGNTGDVLVQQSNGDVNWEPLPTLDPVSSQVFLGRFRQQIAQSGNGMFIAYKDINGSYQTTDVHLIMMMRIYHINQDGNDASSYLSKLKIGDTLEFFKTDTNPSGSSESDSFLVLVTHTPTFTADYVHFRCLPLRSLGSHNSNGYSRVFYYENSSVD